MDDVIKACVVLVIIIVTAGVPAVFELVGQRVGIIPVLQPGPDLGRYHGNPGVLFVIPGTKEIVHIVSRQIQRGGDVRGSGLDIAGLDRQGN